MKFTRIKSILLLSLNLLICNTEYGFSSNEEAFDEAFIRDLLRRPMEEILQVVSAHDSGDQHLFDFFLSYTQQPRSKRQYLRCDSQFVTQSDIGEPAIDIRPYIKACQIAALLHHQGAYQFYSRYCDDTVQPNPFADTPLQETVKRELMDQVLEGAKERKQHRKVLSITLNRLLAKLTAASQVKVLHHEQQRLLGNTVIRIRNYYQTTSPPKLAQIRYCTFGSEHTESRPTQACDELFCNFHQQEWKAFYEKLIKYAQEVPKLLGEEATDYKEKLTPYCNRLISVLTGLQRTLPLQNSALLQTMISFRGVTSTDDQDERNGHIQSFLKALPQVLDQDLVPTEKEISEAAENCFRCVDNTENKDLKRASAIQGIAYLERSIALKGDTASSQDHRQARFRYHQAAQWIEDTFADRLFFHEAKHREALDAEVQRLNKADLTDEERSSMLARIVGEYRQAATWEKDCDRKKEHLLNAINYTLMKFKSQTLEEKINEYPDIVKLYLKCLKLTEDETDAAYYIAQATSFIEDHVNYLKSTARDNNELDGQVLVKSFKQYVVILKDLFNRPHASKQVLNVLLDSLVEMSKRRDSMTSDDIADVIEAFRLVLDVLETGSKEFELGAETTYELWLYKFNLLSAEERTSAEDYAEASLFFSTYSKKVRDKVLQDAYFTKEIEFLCATDPQQKHIDLEMLERRCNRCFLLASQTESMTNRAKLYKTGLLYLEEWVDKISNSSLPFSRDRLTEIAMQILTLASKIYPGGDQFKTQFALASYAFKAAHFTKDRTLRAQHYLMSAQALEALVELLPQQHWPTLEHLDLIADLYEGAFSLLTDFGLKMRALDSSQSSKKKYEDAKVDHPSQESKDKLDLSSAFSASVNSDLQNFLVKAKRIRKKKASDALKDEQQESSPPKEVVENTTNLKQTHEEAKEFVHRAQTDSPEFALAHWQKAIQLYETWINRLGKQVLPAQLKEAEETCLKAYQACKGPNTQEGNENSHAFLRRFLDYKRKRGEGLAELMSVETQILANAATIFEMALEESDGKTADDCYKFSSIVLRVARHAKDPRERLNYYQIACNYADDLVNLCWEKINDEGSQAHITITENKKHIDQPLSWFIEYAGNIYLERAKNMPDAQEREDWLRLSLQSIQEIAEKYLGHSILDSQQVINFQQSPGHNAELLRAALLKCLLSVKETVQVKRSMSSVNQEGLGYASPKTPRKGAFHLKLPETTPLPSPLASPMTTPRDSPQGSLSSPRGFRQELRRSLGNQPKQPLQQKLKQLHGSPSNQRNSRRYMSSSTSTYEDILGDKSPATPKRKGTVSAPVSPRDEDSPSILDLSLFKKKEEK